jgi:hypothetical protein
MRKQALASKLAIFCVLIGMGLGVAPVFAEVVNIDLEGDPPNDTTHSGADGVLSGAGSVWNGVDAGVDALDLQDESGSMTDYDLVFTSSSGTTDGSATNDLQDSGVSGSFSVSGLSDGVQYDVAVYAFPFSFIAFTESTGFSGVGCTGSATYALPGTQDSDYCLLEDVMPADLGSGEFGFTIAGVDGFIAGVQIAGPGGGGGSEPVPALSPVGSLALAICLIGAAGYTARRGGLAPID